jgi:aspartyl/asparaginyl beta-hydroxylase (cupin superfamily)
MNRGIDFERLERESFAGLTPQEVDGARLPAEERLEIVKKMLAEKRLPVSPHAGRKPAFFYPGLRSQPTYETTEFPWASMVQAHVDDFLSELRALEANRREESGFHRVWPEFTESGEWAALWLRLYGEPYHANASKCPITMAVMDAIPRQGGWLGFSALAGRTHLAPHCGVSNAKLRCHVPLQLEAGLSRIRVDGHVHTWALGEPFVFDDSYEHEVWNDSEEKRVILIFDIFHPDLNADEVEFLTAVENLTVKRSYNALMERYRVQSPNVEWVRQ